MTDITREQIEALLKLADAATPGPWGYYPDVIPGVILAGEVQDTKVRVISDGDEPMDSENPIFPKCGVVSDIDATFIAAANPAVMKALCRLALKAKDMEPSNKTTVYIVLQNGGLYDSIIHDSEDDAWCDLEKMTDEPRETLQLDGFEVEAFTLTSLPDPKE